MVEHCPGEMGVNPFSIAIAVPYTVNSAQTPFSTEQTIACVGLGVGKGLWEAGGGCTGESTRHCCGGKLKWLIHGHSMSVSRVARAAFQTFRLWLALSPPSDLSDNYVSDIGLFYVGRWRRHGKSRKLVELLRDPTEIGQCVVGVAMA